MEPHRKESSDGSLTLTWIYGARRLSFTATTDCILYLRSWEFHLTAPDAGIFAEDDAFETHWRWLRSLSDFPPGQP